MIRYKISCTNPASQFLEIELTFPCKKNEEVLLQLPAWRAGRYQLANYAQNLRRFDLRNSSGHKIPFEKKSKDLWRFYPEETGEVKVSYDYWAGKMDAGSAWTDDQQVYINLVNCCFDLPGRGTDPIEVTFNLPDFPNQASTLQPKGDSKWVAENFQMLADSTFLAAKELTHWSYQISETTFHIWIHGQIHFDRDLFLSQFRAFSKRLIEDFGEFPETEYHFIFQFLPYPHYHGVEHRKGTVITFGPAESLTEPEQMEELLGISCHELYHAWNVCRIRPKEFLPYDFSKETYTKNGIILEGVTTYMGDLYLLKSGVYDLSTYLKHLGKIISREAIHFGWKNYNILESSHDLWLDGYSPGIPDRKVNIYSRGALLALCVDLLLIKNGSSLPLVMTKAWERFGKPFKGYDWQDFELLVFSPFPDDQEIKRFFDDFVFGYKNLISKVKSLLPLIGLELVQNFGQDLLLHNWGIRVSPENIITQIHPEAKAYHVLMKNDKIQSYSEISSGTILLLDIERSGRKLTIELTAEEQLFFPDFTLVVSAEKRAFEDWIK